MAPSKDPSPERPSADSAADLAQAYRDLARGEQAATALEANLNNLENKLDALLAAMDGMDEGDDGSNANEGGGTGVKAPAQPGSDNPDGKAKANS